MKPSSDHLPFNRREFLARSAQFAGATLLGSSHVFAEEKKATGETLVQQLFGSLDDAQRKAVCRSWDDPLRHEVDNNWHILPDAKVGKVFRKDQIALVENIFRSLHSEEYSAEVWRQYEEDNKGDSGFAGASVALFGTPGSGKFEFVLTGRHCTRRCDGDSTEGTAFGGPIFYGHASKSFNESPAHEGNVYWFQAKRANELFAALDGKQREKALITRVRKESGTETVELSGKASGIQGIPVSELSADQKELMRKVLADLLKPFRKTDADEAMKLIEKSGFDSLHMAYAKQGDLGNDQVWDNWQVEGPSMIWIFRGAPHVHCWANIRESAKA